jgi:hypothetical protein
MQLLVSVRSEEEVADALAGGADIIDAKEPARGSLGPVTAAVLRRIAVRVPEPVPLSVALGDLTAPDAVRAAVAAAGAVAPVRTAPVYLKLGFARERSSARVSGLLESARAAAGGTPIARCLLVAVAYADAEAAGSPPPEDMLRSAIAAGADALLLDTCVKDGRTLLDHAPLARLAALSVAARAAGLLFAVAGSLDLASIERVADLADVVGVRGAACLGGREGRVDAARVGELRRRLAHPRPVRSTSE